MEKTRSKAKPSQSSAKTTKTTTLGRSRPASARGLATKLSASMSALLAQSQEVGPQSQMLTRVLASHAVGPDPADAPVHVFVRIKAKSAPAGFPELETTSKRAVRTALVPLGRVTELAAHPGVTRISAPRELRALMDVARPLVRVPEFRQQTQSSGRGVIVGIVDSGLDVSHPAFAGRVLSLWDQTVQGNGPGASFVRLGAVLTGSAMTTSLDRNGHGTHVTGIAAGAAVPFEGVAPEADIIAVKTNFQNTAIAEGVRWIFSEATRLNRPAVVNLSLGGHGDSHDGSDDLSAAIEQELGVGRIVVAAAGNEGTDAIHSSQPVSARQAAIFSIRLAPNSTGDTPQFFILNGWYSGAGTCEVRLKSSTGLATPFQAVLTEEPTAKNYLLQNDHASIATPPAASNPNGDHQFFIVVESGIQGFPVQGGVWSLEVRRSSGNPEDVHVWLLLPPSAKSTAAEFFGAGQSFSHLIGSPGAAGEVITVASFTSRNQWIDSTGVSRAVGLALNTISDFSSPGPRRDGAPKPDFAAPGAMIASCLSNASISPQIASSILAPGFRANAGTSMATPFISGVIALLLQEQPALTPAKVKDFLRQRCRVPGSPLGTHDPKWGFGLLKL
jgi:subtilisin family serine protease